MKKTGLLFLVAAACLSAQTPEEAARRDPFLAPDDEIRAMIPRDDTWAATQACVQFDWIRLPHVTANQLLRRHLLHSTDGDALYAAVQELIAQQKATRLDLTATVVRSGQRTKVESVIEKSYPTEFDPAQSIEYVTPAGAKVLDGFTHVTPSSFTFRHTGRTVEVEATVDAETGLIDLNMAAEWVEHLRDWTWGAGVSAVKQPVFGTAKMNTQMLCGNGEWELAGLFNPPWLPEGDRLPGSAPLPADRMLLFVRATVAGKTEAPAKPRTRQVTALLEWIETDTAAASALLARFPAFADAGELREAMEPMLADGRASLLESAAIPVRGGQRSKLESITEFPYPTEFDPPQGGSGGANPPPPAANPPNVHIVPSTANSYTFRNLGTTVELEATVGQDGLIIDMHSAPELVFPAGIDTHGEAESESKQMRFQALKSQSQLLLRAGTPAMAGVFDAPVTDDKPLPAVRARKVLLFIRGIL